ECGDMPLGSHRLAELIVLVIDLDDGARQLRALLEPKPLGQRACRDVAYHHFERNDFHFADQLLAHVEAPDEVGRNSNVVQVLKDVFRDPIVENALAFDHVVLLRVEGGRIVLEVLDQGSRSRSFVEDLALAFIDAATAAHRRVPWFVHLDAVAPVEALDPRQRRGGSTRRERATRPRRKASRSGATAQSRWNSFVAQGLRISPVALTIASRYARARGDFHACG